MESHPPSSRQHKPGQPFDILEANTTKKGISPSSSSSPVPIPVASPSLSQGRFSPPTPRHTSSGNSNLTLNIISSPVESTLPSGISTPYLSTTKNHVVRETNKAFKYYEGGRKLINQYHVVKELGRGVHGKVKRAVNTETGETVAIKIIPRFSKKRRLGKLTAQSNDSGRNMREIAILKKIRHPNIVALLEVIDDPELKKIYMVLEYLEIGEVVWRKKGLPHICDYERKRVCPYINSGAMVDEDDKVFRQQRLQEHLGDLYRIKQEEERIGSHSQDDHGEYWPSVEREINEVSVEDHEDTSSMAMSRDYSTHNFAGLEPGLSLSTSFPSSVAASRATSRTPSRNQSISSLVHHYNTGIMKTMQINEEPMVAKSVVYDPEGSDMESHRGHRNSTLSRPSSVLSSFSANDFEPGLVTHDPFADDFSYVPCFTYERARIAFRDTVVGLEYLHYQGIIHRDIKPANLLWTRDRHVKISDFGVSYFGRPIRDGEDEGTLSESEAIDFDDDRELSKTVGTPAFFAPELCYTDLNAAETYKVSEQIDVWSLGVTLYCLIYARIPFLAEDEYQMFRKIATEEPYLSDIRLAPVDPTTTPTTSSLFQRQNRAPFRDDNDLVYEKVEPELRDLLSRMLTKNPEKRIRLHEIKRHSWVLRDIPNPEVWLEETDPAKPSEGRRIQVDDHELDDAVVPLTFFERARSVVKKTVAKVGKVIHPLGGGERDAKQTRRRAPSSNTGSSVDLRSHLQGSALPRDGPLSRRRSIRPDEPHPLVNSMSVNSPLSPQSTSSLFDQLAGILPEMSTHYNPNASAMSREQVQEKSLEEPCRRMSDLRHSASLRSHRNSHSKSKSGHALDRASVLSHENALNRPVFDSADDHSDDGLVMRSTSRTRGATHNHVPTVRSQSPIAITTVRATVSANATAPSSPCRSRHGRTIQSVDLSRSHYTAVSSSKGINNFLCLTAVDAKHSAPASPKVDTRPITAHRMTPSVPVTPTIPEARESGLSLHGEPATAANMMSHSDSEDEEEDEDEGLFMATSRTRASTGTKSTQSTEASAADMSMSSTDSPADEGQCSKQVSCVNVAAYQSDPSLPALLSGASSVSVDLDNDGDEISTEAISKIYRTTDSMTPPALAKDRTESGVFDVEPSENIIPVQLDQQSHVSHIVSINGPLRTSAGEIQPDNSKNVHSTRSHSMGDEDQADDADDSDSDEGLTLPMRRRSRLPETTYHPRFPPRRRDTNASICSSDTAKKVDCSQ